MNTHPEALRLADELDVGDFDVVTNYEAASELRRMHDLLGKANALCRIRAEEIERLKAQPAQEPVAWMFEFPDKRVKPKFDSAPHGGNWQPLYIHPQPDAYGYAKRLAEAIWKKHYQSTAPQWEPFDDLMGVLTQIDNMTAGLTTPPAAQRQWVGLSDVDLADCTTEEYETALYWERVLREKNAAAQPAYDQTALELCKVCGWKTLIPGDVCLNCEHEASARRQWVGLTDEEIEKLAVENGHATFLNDDEETGIIWFDGDATPFARAIEQKMREKNGGAA